MSDPRRSWTVALVAWTVLVWTTRVNNIWADGELTAGEKWGRTGLAASFTVLAIAVAAALWRRAAWARPVVGVLAGWTLAVWLVRSAGIVRGHHAAGFVAVHLVLAVASVALAALAWHEWRVVGAARLSVDR